MNARSVCICIPFAFCEDKVVNEMILVDDNIANCIRLVLSDLDASNKVFLICRCLWILQFFLSDMLLNII